MAFRGDINVRWNLSPRIVTIASPSVEITNQDLHDTLTELEARPENIIYPRIIESAGKEELGGGVKVGITSKLLDAKVAFEARKTSVSSGTVTSEDVTGRVLVDAAATFVSKGIQPGSWVVNMTDGSTCTVLVVESQTQLFTDVLGDGVDNQFNVGDAYKAWNVQQVNVAGGNLVAEDVSGSISSPVLPTAGTQVIRTASSSATLQELLDIQFNTFQGGVTYDSTSPYAGTQYPVGTARQPVNNLVDALAIMQINGFRKFYWNGSVTVDNGLNYDDVEFRGNGQSQSQVAVTSSALTLRCAFFDCNLSGTLDGQSRVHDCAIDKINYVDGLVEGSELEAPLLSDPDPFTVRLSGQRALYLVDCYADASTHTGELKYAEPIVDMGSSGSALIMSDYSGGVKIINKHGGDHVSIALDAGYVVLDSTVTSGTIGISGVGTVIDNSTGTVVDTSRLLSPSSIAASVWNASVSGSTSGSAGHSLNVIESVMLVVRDALIVATGSVLGSSTQFALKTNLLHADNFFDNMFVQVLNSSGSATRRVESYAQVSGTIDVSSDPFPFVPTVGDNLLILAQHQLNVKGGFG